MHEYYVNPRHAIGLFLDVYSHAVNHLKDLHILVFPSSHTQLIIKGKIGYMFRLEQAIIRSITRTLEGNKTASRCEISDLCG
jgi:hypothetical protein